MCASPGIPGTPGDSGDGPGTSSSLNEPSALAVTSWGDVYIGAKGSRVIKKLSGGMLTRVAGTGGASELSAISSTSVRILSVAANLAVDLMLL